MATRIPVSVARFHHFTPAERDTLHFALVTTAKRVLEDAELERLPTESLEGAAATFAQLSVLARDLDLMAGREPSGDEHAIGMMAAVIAAGEAPEMKRLAVADLDLETVDTLPTEAELAGHDDESGGTCPEPGGCDSCPDPQHCADTRGQVGLTTAEDEANA